MKVLSYERTTGRGARHETQVRWDGEWYPVSAFTDAVHEGRDSGFEIFSLTHWNDPSTVRAYHRSNSGRVSIVEGMMAGPNGSDIPCPELEEAAIVQ